MKITTTKSVAKIVEIELEQKLKEIAKKNLKQLLNILHNAPAAIAVYEVPEYKYILANKAYEKLTNRKEKDLLGKNFRDVFPELTGTGTFEIFDHVFKTGEPFTTPEYVALVDIKNDGVLKQCYFNFSMEPLKNDSGEIYAVIAMTYDITEQVEAKKIIERSEKALRTSQKALEKKEQQLQNIFHATTVAIVVLEGPEHKYTFVNPVTCQILNRTKKELLGKTVKEVFPEVEAQGTIQLCDEVYNTGKPFAVNELSIQMDILKNGVVRQNYFNLSCEPLRDSEDKIYAILVTGVDVTEQVDVRKRIEESEIRYRTLFNSIDSGFCVLEVLFNENEMPYNYRFLETNNAFEKQTGLIDAVGKTMKELAHGHEQYWFDIYGRIAKTRKPERFENEAKALGIYYEVFAFPVGEPEENRVGVLFNNITERKQTEEKIRASEQRYHAMFMNSPFAFSIMKGKDMRVTLVNDLMKEFWGKGKDVEGKTRMQILPELNDQPFPVMLDSVYTTGIPVYANEMLAQLNRHGIMEDRYFNIVYEPYFETGETISGVITIAHEVTQQVLNRKKIEESEQRFQAAVAAVQGVLWTNNAKGKMEGDQLGWGSLTGQNYEAYKGYGWTDAIHPDDVQATVEAWHEAVRECKHFVFEHRVRLKNGNWGHFSVKAIPLLNADGLVREWVGVHTDITEQKEAYNKIEAATLSAQEAMKAKQQFLSNMSHEIRTPLNSIIGFANVLLKTELGVQQKEFLQAIKTSGKSLNLLIDDILDLAKVDTGKMTFEKQPFEIRKSISSILHSFDLKIKEKNLKLVEEYDSKIPSMLLGDTLRLNQIFLNLLGNAVKFTHKGRIILSVKLLSETQESVTLEFTVTDSGIGIAANKMNSIFNLFEQAELSTANSYGGTGLGLAIVKQLVEAQAGSISVKSKLDEGSIFSFILPFGKTNIKSEGEVEILKSDSETKNLRVLVAEDIALNQLLIKLILSDFGFEYEIAENGRIAIERMQTNTYDIILMDLQMPEMNGFETTEYIRKTMKSEIPIIALTADVTTVDVAKCKEFGMDDYISKPIDENLLYSKIVELVKQKQ